MPTKNSRVSFEEPIVVRKSFFNTNHLQAPNIGQFKDEDDDDFEVTNERCSNAVDLNESIPVLCEENQQAVYFTENQYSILICKSETLEQINNRIDGILDREIDGAMQDGTKITFRALMAMENCLAQSKKQFDDDPENYPDPGLSDFPKSVAQQLEIDENELNDLRKGNEENLFYLSVLYKVRDELLESKKIESDDDTFDECVDVTVEVEGLRTDLVTEGSVSDHLGSRSKGSFSEDNFLSGLLNSGSSFFRSSVNKVMKLADHYGSAPQNKHQ